MAAKFFISYRREDSKYQARMIHAAFCQVVPRDHVFMDVDSIPPGANFRTILKDWLDQCEVLLALIGPGWIDASDPNTKQRRLDNPSDLVRIEIGEALARDIPVVPVLIDGTPLPDIGSLPDDLKKLRERQAEYVTYRTFDADVERLITKLKLSQGVGRTSPLEQPIPAPAPVSSDDRPRAEGRIKKGLPFGRRAAAAGLAALVLGGGVLAYQMGVPMPWAPNRDVEAKRQAEQAAKVKADAQSEAILQPAPAEKAKQAEVRRAANTLAATKKADEEAQAKRAVEESERQRLPMLKAEEDKGRAEEDRKRAEADSSRPGREFRDCRDVCPELVVVPAGEFMMGSPPSEEGRDSAEGPVRKVSIQRPFAVAKYSVTRGEFAAFVQETSYRTEGGCFTRDRKEWKYNADKSWRSPGFTQDDRHPVVCVNWDDAKAYAHWLSAKTGKIYQLLSEGEREYAARGVTTATPQPRYHFGNDAGDLCKYANGADQTTKKTFSDSPVAPCEDGFVYTSPAGSFRPNAFGLYDMHGNVWNWTEDCRNESYHGAPIDASARTSGDCGYRVVRGGSWFSAPQVLRSANRDWDVSVYRYHNLGFRVGRTLTP